MLYLQGKASFMMMLPAALWLPSLFTSFRQTVRCAPDLKRHDYNLAPHVSQGKPCQNVYDWAVRLTVWLQAAT